MIRVVGCLGVILTLGLPAFGQAEPSKPSATRQAIPLEGIPEDLHQLLKAGKVEVVYDSDPDFVEADRGWADFHWDIQRTFEFRTTRVAREFAITVTKVELEIELTHLIRIPVTHRTPTIWTNSLMRHEFDHVAISLDPRPKLLIKYLLNHLPVLKQAAENEKTLSNELAVKVINDEIDKRIKAVRDVMIYNNQQVDRISRHGRVGILRRREFFESLYSKANLAEAKFPYLDHVLRFLDSAAYREAELPFLPLDPTQRKPY